MRPLVAGYSKRAHPQYFQHHTGQSYRRTSVLVGRLLCFLQLSVPDANLAHRTPQLPMHQKMAALVFAFSVFPDAGVGTIAPATPLQRRWE